MILQSTSKLCSKFSNKNSGYISNLSHKYFRLHRFDLTTLVTFGEDYKIITPLITSFFTPLAPHPTISKRHYKIHAAISFCKQIYMVKTEAHQLLGVT